MLSQRSLTILINFFFILLFWLDDFHYSVLQIANPFFYINQSAVDSFQYIHLNYCILYLWLAFYYIFYLSVEVLSSSIVLSSLLSFLMTISFNSLSSKLLISVSLGFSLEFLLVSSFEHIRLSILFGFLCVFVPMSCPESLTLSILKEWSVDGIGELWQASCSQGRHVRYLVCHLAWRSGFQMGHSGVSVHPWHFNLGVATWHRRGC